ncbi:MAG: NAD kinase [Dysgonamonadaceae bacterium]|jgi:NAD+ kinase|nr:NAD kinase [Dysgonamonadaceae bacterium]
MKIGIFGNKFQTGKQECIRRLFDGITRRGGKILVESDFYLYLTSTFGYKPEIDGLIEEEATTLPDLAASVGGDGTFLRTAAWVGARDIPILGINTGHLGFLADNDAADVEQVIDDIFARNYSLEERSLLEIDPGHFFPENSNFALNEIAVLKRDTSSMISVKTWLNESYLTTYWADGLIMATPTGSTAYSMSVNGPILVPQAKNFVLSPVAPHSLNVRPLVIPEDYVIRLKAESRSSNFLVSLDGRSRVFPSGSEFMIRKAGFTVKIIKLANHSFYETLRQKLLWGTDTR